MKAIVAAIAGLGLASAINSPWGAWPGEQRARDRTACSASTQQTQSGDDVTGSITRGFFARVSGSRILVGVVSVWFLVGLAVLTIVLSAVSDSTRARWGRARSRGGLGTPGGVSPTARSNEIADRSSKVQDGNHVTVPHRAPSLCSILWFREALAQ
jgi:hypothetical protein